MDSKEVSKQEALDEALKIIDNLIEIAKDSQVAEVTIGTFRTIGTIREVAAR